MVYYKAAKQHLYSAVRNNIVRIDKDDSISAPVEIPVNQHFGLFFAANTRSGSAPSNTIDVIGSQRSKNAAGTVNYTRI